MDVEEQGNDAPRDKTATVAIMLRVREDLRLTLEQAAKNRRVSLNQEIVDRLEYVRDRVGLLPQVLELAYGPHLAGILMLLAVGMEEAGKLRMDTARDVAKMDTWTEHPTAYDSACLAAVALLLALRPTQTNMRRRKADNDLQNVRRVLTDLVRDRGRSDALMVGRYRGIRSMLGRIAKRMTEPMVEVAWRHLAQIVSEQRYLRRASKSPEAKEEP